MSVPGTRRKLEVARSSANREYLTLIRLISKERGWHHTKNPDHLVTTGSGFYYLRKAQCPPPFFDNHMVTRTQIRKT